MTWDELLNENVASDFRQILTDVDCPKCGRKIYFDDSMVILTSYPAKYHYWCSCGWTGTAHVKWRNENQ